MNLYGEFKECSGFTDIFIYPGYKFKAIKGLFNNYIDYWMNEKINAGKEGNGAKRQIAKLMLNSLYRCRQVWFIWISAW